MTKQDEPTPPPQVSMWQAMQNVTIHSLDRGQFLQVGILAITGLLVWKLDGKDAASVLKELFRIFQGGWLFGWIIGVTALVAWYTHVKWMRNATQKEFTRLAEERNTLQQRLTDSQINSSRPKLSKTQPPKP